MTKEIIIRIDAKEILGQLNEEFEIISKHDIYKIPLSANVMDTQSWLKLDYESRQLNKKSILKSHIKEIKVRFLFMDLISLLS